MFYKAFIWHRDDHSLYVFLIVLKGIIATISLVGNALIISSILAMKKKDRTIYAMSKLSLALTGEIMSVTGVISVTNEALFKNQRFKLEAIIIAMGTTCITIAFLNVSLMALQRCYAITYPLKYSKITKKCQLVFILCIWLASVPIFVPIYLVLLNSLSLPWLVLLIMFPLMLSLSLLVPLGSTLTMCISYIRYTRSNSLHSSDCSAVSNARDHRKIVRMTSSIVIAYFVTSVPTIALTICFLIYGYNEKFLMISYKIEPLIYLSGISDFIVYIIIDAQFRNYVMFIFRERMCSWCSFNLEPRE